jgi:hypothetical protein
MPTPASFALDVTIAAPGRAAGAAAAARFPALAAGGACLFGREFMRMATGMRRTPALTGDLALLRGIHAGETAALDLLRVATLTLATSLFLIVLAIGHVVLLVEW